MTKEWSLDILKMCWNVFRCISSYLTYIFWVCPVDNSPCQQRERNQRSILFFVFQKELFMLIHWWSDIIKLTANILNCGLTCIETPNTSWHLYQNSVGRDSQLQYNAQRRWLASGQWNIFLFLIFNTYIGRTEELSIFNDLRGLYYKTLRGYSKKKVLHFIHIFMLLSLSRFRVMWLF